MARKKILVITYYWPPSGGGGVQRWLKFVKYLPQLGWEPIVFTPENPAFELKDESLMKDIDPNLEVIKFPIWEPFGLYKKIFKKRKKIEQGIAIEKTNMSMGDRLSIWLRANFFIPDPRRFWIRSSVDFLLPFIDEHDIDVIVTTGPPHSMHLIGLELRKKSRVKWLADFRDPWSDWDILDKLGVRGIARSIHRKQERKVLKYADVVLTASGGIRKSLQDKDSEANVTVITNGYDPDDLVPVDTQDNKFRITHMGLLNELRNPEVLWKCLEEICEESPTFKTDLELVLAGMVSGSILDRIKSSEHLRGVLNYLGYVSHEKVLEYYQNSSLLLLLLNPRDESQLIIPGKIFEYLMVGKPVLAIGKPQSEVHRILEDTNGGEMLSAEEHDRMKQLIMDHYEQFRNGETTVAASNTEKYKRSNLTKVLVDRLNSMIE